MARECVVTNTRHSPRAARIIDHIDFYWIAEQPRVVRRSGKFQRSEYRQDIGLRTGARVVFGDTGLIASGKVPSSEQKDLGLEMLRSCYGDLLYRLIT